MACDLLMKGMDFSCARNSRKWEQKVVLINRADLMQKNIESNYDKNRTEFNLKATTETGTERIDSRQGYAVVGSENGSGIDGWFDKSKSGELITYTHKVTFPVVGLSEGILTFLKQIDNSDLFAVVRFFNGEIVVFGLNYGLESGNYSYKPQSRNNGALMELSSNYDEFDPPYIYTGNPSDFDNLFENTEPLGSFNFDFDNSFEKIQ